MREFVAVKIRKKRDGFKAGWRSIRQNAPNDKGGRPPAPKIGKKRAFGFAYKNRCRRPGNLLPGSRRDAVRAAG